MWFAFRFTDWPREPCAEFAWPRPGSFRRRTSTPASRLEVWLRGVLSASGRSPSTRSRVSRAMVCWQPGLRASRRLRPHSGFPSSCELCSVGCDDPAVYRSWCQNTRPLLFQERREPSETSSAEETSSCLVWVLQTEHGTRRSLSREALNST